MQDDETEDAQLVCNRPGKCFRTAFFGNYFEVADFTIYLEMVGRTCIMDVICYFLIYHIQMLRS